MADCPCLKECPFFNDHMQNQPATSEALKQVYCKGENTNCARFIVFKSLGKGKTPADLFPNDVYRAKEIVKKAGKDPDEKK